MPRPQQIARQLNGCGNQKLSLVAAASCALARAFTIFGAPAGAIHTAEFDPVRERLRQAGVAARYTCHEGLIHHVDAK